jgi:hypothetical protein
MRNEVRRVRLWQPGHSLHSWKVEGVFRYVWVGAQADKGLKLVLHICFALIPAPVYSAVHRRAGPFN